MAVKEARVPDIGNYKDVPVIELLVGVGDTVAKDQGLITLESDKATMEVPSSAAGTVKELRVKVGDPVAEGTVVAILETGAAAAVPAPSSPMARACSRQRPGASGIGLSPAPMTAGNSCLVCWESRFSPACSSLNRSFRVIGVADRESITTVLT